MIATRVDGCTITWTVTDTDVEANSTTRLTSYVIEVVNANAGRTYLDGSLEADEMWSSWRDPAERVQVYVRPIVEVEPSQ